MLDYTETLYVSKKIEQSEMRLQVVQDQGKALFETRLPAITLGADRYSQTGPSIRKIATRMQLYTQSNTKSASLFESWIESSLELKD